MTWFEYVKQMDEYEFTSFLTNLYANALEQYEPISSNKRAKIWTDFKETLNEKKDENELPFNIVNIKGKSSK